jgi:hypothetical protein
MIRKITIEFSQPWSDKPNIRPTSFEVVAIGAIALLLVEFMLLDSGYFDLAEVETLNPQSSRLDFLHHYFLQFHPSKIGENERDGVTILSLHVSVTDPLNRRQSFGPFQLGLDVPS